MGGTDSKENPISSTNSIVKTTSSTTHNSDQPIFQSFFLVWVDVNIDKSKADYQNTLAQLENVVSEVHVFNQPDQCIDFLNNIENEKVVLITSGTLGRHLMSDIHDLPQLDSIYIFCRVKDQHLQWTKKWSKIQGIYTNIKPLCEVLKCAVKQSDQDSVAMSFVSVDEEIPNLNLNRLESTFMYTEIFKDILLDLEYNEQSIKDLTTYCRKRYKDNKKELDIINEFERDYRLKSPIWWYTRECFTYQMLNRALRTLEADTIIHMGVFIHDLHQQLRQLHREQIVAYRGKTFMLYRGQGLLKTEFEKLTQLKGSLMSFSNFLSTSKKQNVSLGFARNALGKSNMVGILFRMSIDPSIFSTPYASIRQVSFFKTEEEILFSMHSVFRVTEITKIDKQNPLYQVDLKLTGDDDPELRALTTHILQEIDGETGWERVGKLLIKLGQNDKAEEIYKVFLEQTSDEKQQAKYYGSLGHIKEKQGDYNKALEYYEKILEIRQKTLPPEDPSVAGSYGNIATVYYHKGEYSKALSFAEKALEIKLKTLHPADTSLAASYVNTGKMYQTMGDRSKALSYYEKGLEILQRTLPPNHPSIGDCHGCIASIHVDLEDYSKALEIFTKDLEISEQTLPPDHPSLAVTYGNLGNVYIHMKDYEKGIALYEKVLEIQKKSLPPDHADLASALSNLGSAYSSMNDKLKALEYYQKALEMRQRIFPEDHPDLAGSYNNLGCLYHDMDEYAIALPLLEKAVEIEEKTYPPGHPSLANTYNTLAHVYLRTDNYSSALLFFEKTLEIKDKTLPPNHRSFAIVYNGLSLVYAKMEDYAKQVSFGEKVRSIIEEYLPPDDEEVITAYNNLADGYNNMQDYPAAIALYETVLEIREKAVPPNDDAIATTYNNIGDLYKNIGENSKALLAFEKALEIRQNIPTINQALLVVSLAKLAGLYMEMGEYVKAMSYLGNVPEIMEAIAPPGDPAAQNVRDMIGDVNVNLINKDE